MNKTLIEKYARLIVKSGINIQKGQTLIITSPVEGAAFVRIITQIAYMEGAREVIQNWRDEECSKIRFMQAPDEVFDEFPSYLKELYLSNVNIGAAFLRIEASDPELMKGVDPGRIARSSKANGLALKEYRERLMSSKNSWCVASIPTGAWAMKVFPELPEEDAIDELWDAIFKAVRVDTEDPVAAWEKHKKNLFTSTDFLNSNQFKYLHYKNALGTDLRVELPEGHIWLGGSDRVPEGYEFLPNMPTEEVFTLPRKTGVNGIVKSSMPFNYYGTLIEDFSLTFKDGRITDFSAGRGYESLKSIIETDEGSHYLGEVALVPYNSPISQSGILFYNTLFDENASCHFAIGKAYPCIKDAEKMDAKKLEELGVNDSIVHEDFMIGTEDLEIIGITISGDEIPVFKNGNFVFQGQ